MKRKDKEVKKGGGVFRQRYGTHVGQFFPVVAVNVIDKDAPGLENGYDRIELPAIILRVFEYLGIDVDIIMFIVLILHHRKP